MKLNQVLGSRGHYPRRKADALIKQGRVTINGQTEANYNYDVLVTDIIAVDGHVLGAEGPAVYLMLNKPVDVICTAAAHVSNNIIDYINYPERIFPVGRLDKHSEGLILLTNDGRIVNQLLKAEHGAEKDYDVTVDRQVTPDFLEALATGVRIYNPRIKDYTVTEPCRVQQLGDDQFRITLTQGLNRQIRRMCRRHQYTVTQLRRIRMKNVTLGDLAVGEWRYLTEAEISDLKK